MDGTPGRPRFGSLDLVGELNRPRLGGLRASGELSGGEMCLGLRHLILSNGSSEAPSPHRLAAQDAALSRR